MAGGRGRTRFLERAGAARVSLVPQDRMKEVGEGPCVS